jgi:hypothetical protein
MQKLEQILGSPISTPTQQSERKVPSWSSMNGLAQTSGQLSKVDDNICKPKRVDVTQSKSGNAMVYPGQPKGQTEDAFTSIFDSGASQHLTAPSSDQQLGHL